jgi:hypothetical protein
MLESTFDPAHIRGLWEDDTKPTDTERSEEGGRVLGVWARDKMGLSEKEYGESCPDDSTGCDTI